MKKLGRLASLSLLSATSFETPAQEIIGLGLTYRDHIVETGGNPDPSRAELIHFSKSSASLVELGEGKATRVRPPSDAETYAALGKLDAKLTERVKKRFEKFPALFDYEGEVGLLLNCDLTEAELKGPRLAGDCVRWFAAQDLSYRGVQVLGEGRSDRMQFWGASKSFAGFTPVGEAFALGDLDLERWPDLRIETRVGSEIRQSASLSSIIYTPRRILGDLVRQRGGRLARGTRILTGTPSGVAFQAKPFEKFLSDRVLRSPLVRLWVVARKGESNEKYLRSGQGLRTELLWQGERRSSVDVTID